MPSTQQWEEQLNRTCLLFGRVLDPSEIEIWRKFLQAIPKNAVLYAFENWQRNGRFFPKPKDILDLVDTYTAGKAPAMFTRYEHHGQGYGGGDMLALWKIVSAKGLAMGRKLSQQEIWDCLSQVDAKRPHGAPAWR